MSEWWSWRGIGSEDGDGTVGLFSERALHVFWPSLVFRWNEWIELLYPGSVSEMLVCD